jgi:GH15 family glucan-1,4-alpha-glucosidase
MGDQPIENYGVIGNMHTAALVGTDGSIDWFCFPSFDSPSVFAAILDCIKGGHFKIAPILRHLTHKQFYWPNTNVLVTRFLSPDGVGQVTDFMPVGVSKDEPGYHWLIRRVNVVRGTMTFRMECYPAFNYARDEHQTIVFPDSACFHSPSLNLELATPIPLKQDGDGVLAEFTLEEGQSVVFVLRAMELSAGSRLASSEQEVEVLFKRTVDFWRRWLSKCSYRGRWREMVQPLSLGAEAPHL